MKFEPMKPAPPVTKIFIASTSCGYRAHASCPRGILFAPVSATRLLARSKRLKRAGVGPPAVQDFVGELAFFDIEIIHVGDFEFSAAGRLQAANFLEDGLVIQIDSDDGIIGFRSSWAFLRCRPRVRREFRRRRSAARR